MVNYREEYQAFLQRGVLVFNALLALYSPDKKAENDWADVTLADTRNKRNGLAERLAVLQTVSAAETSTLVVSLGHYLDGHWADYQPGFPVVNPQKRKQLELLHTELESIINGIGQLYNMLRTSEA